MLSFVDKIEAIQPFTEAEAWWLYRAVALSEAMGWILLITGILINHYHLPGEYIAVPIAGQIHGTIFLIYFGILISVYSSLQWSRKRFVVAAIAGIPPYGTLIFEQWAARKRQAKLRQVYIRSIVLVALTKIALTTFGNPIPSYHHCVPTRFRFKTYPNKKHDKVHACIKDTPLA